MTARRASRSMRMRGGAPSCSSSRSTSSSLRRSIECRLLEWNIAWSSSRPTAEAGRWPSRNHGSRLRPLNNQPRRSTTASAVRPTTRPGKVMKNTKATCGQRAVRHPWFPHCLPAWPPSPRLPSPPQVQASHPLESRAARAGRLPPDRPLRPHLHHHPDRLRSLAPPIERLNLAYCQPIPGLFTISQ
jgi:hypothetical protein